MLLLSRVVDLNCRLSRDLIFLKPKSTIFDEREQQRISAHGR